MFSRSSSLCRQILDQSILGRRGIVKTANLWLPLAVLVSLNASRPIRATLMACLQIFLSVAFWAEANILANDLSDRHDDNASGKQRWIRRLPPGVGIAVVALLAGLGLAVLVPAGGSLAAWAAYATAIALGLAYSVRPVRLKERGFSGLLAYSLSGAFAFVVMPWAHIGGDWRALAALAPAVLLDKWVNLHFHQIVDYESDRRSGTRTYSMLCGLKRARRTLRWAAGLASAWLFAALAFAAMSLRTWQGFVAGAGILVAAAAVVYGRMGRRAGEMSALLQELPSHYLGLTFALFRVVPLILFARLALAGPPIWALFGLAAIVLAGESWYSFRYRYE